MRGGWCARGIKKRWISTTVFFMELIEKKEMDIFHESPNVLKMTKQLTISGQLKNCFIFSGHMADSESLMCSPLQLHLTCANVSCADMIDSGATGKIIKCKIFGFDCALKKIEKKAGSIPDAEPGEINLLANLMHTNVIQLFASWRDNSCTLCICTEFFKWNLSSYLDSIQEWDSDCANEIFKKIVIALRYVHEQGLIHQDIKPANILLNDHKDIKLIDFGVAAVISPDGTLVTEHCVGSKVYSAPDQKAFRAYNQKADVFGLGLVYYELFISERIDVPRVIKIINLRSKIETDSDWRNKGYLMKSWSLNEFSRGWSGDPDLRLDMVALESQK